MRGYNLKIADYRIRFESSSDGPELIPSNRFLKYICSDSDYDLLINVHSGSAEIKEEAERVFHAPLVEEVNGFMIHHKPNFWSIWKSENNLYIKTSFQLITPETEAILKFSLSSKEWELTINSQGNPVDPFEYPLDGLTLYYLTVIYGDIMIHASGVNFGGIGYLFSGISGRGKSTLAILWDKFGAKVVHDDRLIVRKKGDGYVMYNTPVYNNEDPQSSPLNKIYLIDHSPENNIVSVNGATAVTLVMANCIQHNWGHETIDNLLGSITQLCEKIPVARFHFLPDNSAIKYILEDGKVSE
jgi:hypothetical protein